MITKSYSNEPRTSFISAPTSYCALSPVPMSPIAANFTVSGLFGRVMVNFGCWAASAAQLARTMAAARRVDRSRMTLFLERRDRARNEIDDQVRRLIPQDQIAPHEPVL